MTKPTDAEILAIALECGFSLSTAHGQQHDKLMPIADSKTLLAFAHTIRDRIASLTPTNFHMEAATVGEHKDVHAGVDPGQLPPHPRTTTFSINGTDYTRPEDYLYGCQVRVLGNVPYDHKLFLEGIDADIVFDDMQDTPLKNGMKFYSTPQTNGG